MWQSELDAVTAEAARRGARIALSFVVLLVAVAVAACAVVVEVPDVLVHSISASGCKP